MTRHIPISILVCMIMCCAIACTDAAPPSEPDKIIWYTYQDMASILENKDDDRKFMLHFYSVRCGWCTKMNHDVFARPEIVAYINENFIPLRINVSNQPDAVAKYSVGPVPTTWFLKKDGEKLAMLPGYVPPERFRSILRSIKAEK